MFYIFKNIELRIFYLYVFLKFDMVCVNNLQNFQLRKGRRRNYQEVEKKTETLSWIHAPFSRSAGITLEKNNLKF